MKRIKGLTLMEALVIIAVLAVLGATLSPILVNAEAENGDKTQQIACMNNLKQIGIAWMMYLSDYDDRHPLTFINVTIPGYDNGFGWKWYGWKRCLAPYVKNRQIMYCPSYAKSKDAWVPHDTETAAKIGWFELIGGYVGNGYVIGPGNSVAQSDIHKPDKLLLVGEFAYDKMPDVNGEWIKWIINGKPELVIGAPHDGGQNQLFADGHVKWVSLKGFVDTYPTDTDYNGSYLSWRAVGCSP